MKTLSLLVNPAADRHDRRLWLFWGLALTIVLIVHCLTLSISPTIWQDEVQILDYGRSILNPHTDWSINWNFELERPVFAPAYLANVLQEIALRLTRFSVIGPRIVTLVGAMVAATVTLGWLLARQVRPKVAWLISLIFLLDPIFVQSYRGGRVDCWVFATCLGACWLLRVTQVKGAQHQSSYWLVAVVGSLAAVAIFIWPSAVFLYPLVLFELASLLHQQREPGKGRLTQLTAFFTGGILTGIVLLFPIWQQLGAALSDTYALSTTSGGVSASGESISTYFQTVLSTRLVDLGSSFKMSPFLPLAAIVSLFYRRQPGLLFITLFATTLVLNTNVYIYRVIYLLPYCVVLVSTLYQAESRQLKTFPKARWLKSCLLMLLLGWSFSLSMLVRPVIALGQDADRDPRILTDVAASAIGSGEHIVFLLGPVEFYHAGRTLQWKMFWQYLNSPTSYLDMLDDPAYKQTFSRLDYLILPQGAMTPQLQQVMDNVGLGDHFTLLTSSPDLVKGQKSRFRPPQPYGPYVVFRRSA